MTPGRGLDQLRQDYQRHLDWRLASDPANAETDGAENGIPLVAPPSALPWSREYGPLFHSPVRSGDAPAEAHGKRYLPTLAQIADATLIRIAPDLPLDAVKGRFGGRRMARIRHQLVIAMNVAGFQNVEIARFLQLSESAVSKIICARRNGC